MVSLDAIEVRPVPRTRTIDPDAIRFGTILRHLREQRGWTLLKLARRAGMNATYLGVLERGGNIPTLTTILDLAEVLEVEAADIIREIERARKRPKPTVAPLPEQ